MESAFEIRTIEAFVAIAACGSFTAAARDLYLTQPTISSRISTLEASLNARLFDRGHRRARLTPAGETFLPYARKLLRTREDACGAVRNLLGKNSGHLLVGASTVPGAYLLPRLLGRLRRDEPGIRIELRVADSDKTLEALRQRRVEICVVGRTVREKGLTARTVAHDEIVLVAAPRLTARLETRHETRRRRLPVDDVRRLPLVIRESGSATRAATLEALGGKSLRKEDLDIVLEVDSSAAALEATLAGVGASFMSRLAVRDHLRSGRLEAVHLAALRVKRPLVAVALTGRTLSPAAALLDGMLARETP